MSQTFAERWAAKERECGYDEAIFSKMTACGESTLPRSAAPFVTFDYAERSPRVWEVFGCSADWSDADRTRLASYRMIGTDGAGSPFCLDQTTGAVWLLEHEDFFETRQFVNSGVPQLAECLLTYMGERDVERLRSAIGAIDPPAMAEESFWWYEAEDLEANLEADRD